MKTENQFSTANYRLAARQHGDSLTLAHDVHDEILSMHLARIRRMQCRSRSGDDRSARALSLEWERLGDFLRRTGSAARAAWAYTEGLECCTDGVWTDSPDGYVISPGMRFRYWHLLDKLERICAADPRIEAAYRMQLDRSRAEIRRI